MTPERTNWAGNVTFGAARHHSPTSVDELQAFVGGARRLRVLGTGHSFNRLADTPGDQVSVADLPKVLEVDPARRTVTVAAGMRYGELVGPLHERGYALRNLGSLPHISIAGAVATGTHGSGETHGNLATAVRALETVTSDDELTGHLDEVLSSACSVSVFPDWREPVRCEVWLKRRVGDGSDQPPQRWLGARLADGPAPGSRDVPDQLHPAAGGAGSLARAAPPLPARLHPQQRRGAAVGVLRGARLGSRRPGRGGRAARPGGAGAPDSRDPHGGGGRALAEPGLPARQSGAALHLGRRRGGGGPGDFAALAGRFDPEGSLRNDLLDEYIPRNA